MNVGELCKVLEELHGILSAADAKAQSKDIAAFLELFKGAEEQNVEQFLRELEARLRVPAEQAAAPMKLPNKQIVDLYAALLRDAGLDQAAFDAVLARLGLDKAVGKVEADAIAFAYIGFADGRRSWQHKKAALGAIEDWFKQLAYDAVKSRQLDKARYAG